MKQFHNFINGEFVATTKTFENRNPATNAVVGMVHEVGQAEGAAFAAGRNDQALAVMQQVAINNPNDRSVLAAYGKSLAAVGQFVQLVVHQVGKAQQARSADMDMVRAEIAKQDSPEA